VLRCLVSGLSVQLGPFIQRREFGDGMGGDHSWCSSVQEQQQCNSVWKSGVDGG